MTVLPALEQSPTWPDTFRNFYATVDAVMDAASVIARSTREPRILAEHNQRIDGLCDTARVLIAYLDQQPHLSTAALSVRDNIREIVETIQLVRM